MVATSSLSRISIFNISRALLKDHPSPLLVQFSRASSSNAYEHFQDTENRRSSRRSSETRERKRDDVIENMGGVTGFVADVVRHGAVKTKEVAEDMADLAKETMDNAYDSTKTTTRKRRPETLVAKADDNVVDTSEYRSIEDMSKHH